MAKQKNALGRGLGALLTDVNTEDIVHNNRTTSVAFPLIDIDEIEANPYQPRTEFEEEALKELSESIKQQGLIQPITVRKTGHGAYQLISGERRLRASKLAGLTQIPAYIREVDDTAMIEMAIVENIQRENLNAIEIAFSFQKLLEECNITQEELSDKVGKKRTTVANYLRLLKLPIEIQAGIRDDKITMGHARTLITLDDKDLQIQLYTKILTDGLNVRQSEELVRKSLLKGKGKTSKPTLSPEMLNLKEIASKQLPLKIAVKKAKGKGGSLVIHFKNEDELKLIENLFS